MNETNDKRCVILFVKLPEKGRVKSRLAQRMNEDLVLRLYENMVLDTIDILIKGRFPFRICFTPPDARDRILEWLGKEYRAFPQAGDDLGDRMENAFEHVFSEGTDDALLIGSDIPDLTAEVMVEAFTALLKNEAVIGPAGDGGYYLIGLKKGSFTPIIFHDMVWSTKTVFRETMDKLCNASLKVHVLPELTDVDTVEDLETLMSQIKDPALEKSRTRSFLAKHCKGIVK
jgi:rSAM/selenodomain-associated transferase 1